MMKNSVLHDAVEDTDLTFEELENEGFSERVMNALRLLTHDGKLRIMITLTI